LGWINSVNVGFDMKESKKANAMQRIQ